MTRGGAWARREWSLKSRITSGFAIASTVISLVILSLSYLYVRRAVYREIASLASEELEEMRLLYAFSGDASIEHFDSIAKELGESHPASPFAWRIWRADSDTIVHAVGSPAMLEISAPLDVSTRETIRLDRHYYWTTSDLDEDLRMGLLIDAVAQQRILSRYAVAGLIGLSLATLIASLGGGLFARSVERQLDDVARGVRSVTDTSKGLELRMPNAPAEVRKVAEAFGVMLENIREESERARLITAGLAHELRAPIQNMQGEAEVGLLRERRPEQYRAILESQLDELRDLGRVVDNLVTLTSPGRSPESRPSEQFDLGSEATLRLSREDSHARRSEVTLEIEAEGDLVVDGDREALILAIRNLVANAIQWSSAGDTVHLRLCGREAEVLVQVDDQGPGVPPEDRERIFEPFVSKRAVDGRRMGYGLGLALAKQAVDSHGGRIAVGPSDRGGACFSMVLPKSPAA